MLPGLCSNILSEHKPGNMEQYLGMFIHSPNSQYLFKCASFIHLFQKVQVLHLFMFSVYYVITNQEPIASRWAILFSFFFQGTVPGDKSAARRTGARTPEQCGT
ncbi:hypothetical protein ABEB36_007358 [Hypothenemus hampei]|uniref:Uncharacterized protein n=1 Tax=Hypothenemus hampei TaxID=57062 RepID=A0ABD1EU83_HYPHA